MAAGAAAGRAFGGDLPKLDFCHKLRGVYWTIKPGDQNATVDGWGLVVARPQSVWSYAAKTRIKIEMYLDALARGSITTPASAFIQSDTSAVAQAVYAALWLLAPSPAWSKTQKASLKAAL